MSSPDGIQPRAADQSTAPELNNPNFQNVLKELLAGYQPVLEQQLDLARNPQQLQQDAQKNPPNCADEFEEANQLFGKFLTENVALQLIPEKNRAQIGPIEKWSWCLQHIRCCIIFGWLVCRRPRTFRAWAFYVYQYWLCVRQSLGTPVANPPTEEERRDFTILIGALANAYKPYLTDQLASVDFPAGIPEEVLNGEIDCFEGQEETCAIFERLLTTEAAQALLGKAAFASSSQEPNFWLCRCWCLCSLCFGCCLARARTFIEVLWCLVYYFRCLENCFRPLTCAITNPTAGECSTETFYPSPGVIGIEIDGTATGIGCGSYILEWRDPVLLTPYTQSYITYASPAPPGGLGACGKISATLGYLQTYGTPVPSPVEVRLTVFNSEGGQPCVQEVQFQIFRTRVSIENVAGVGVPNWTDPNSQLTGLSPARTLSFGDAMQISGHAWVGSCPGRTIKRYTLSYQPGFVTDPTSGSWTQFWEVDYTSGLQQAAIESNYMDLTSIWDFIQICLPPPFPPCPPYPIQYDELVPLYWYSGVAAFPPPGPAAPPTQGPFPIVPELPPPGNIWATQTLPSNNCFSGQYTLRLAVEDTLGNFYYDTQQAWFDNKDIYGEITGILGVAPCAVINLSQIVNAGNCGVAWPLAIQGIAYDEYILESVTTVPSDNFGGYCMTVTRQGGSEAPPCTPISESVALPIPNPTSPVTVGTNRVGDPGLRCASDSPPPSGSITKQINTLTVVDARMFDANCACKASPAPPTGFALNRADPINNIPGECCAYWFTLDVWDNTVCQYLSGGHHSAIPSIWPIYICNDLPPLPPGAMSPCP